MPERGGTATQSGILYQNSVAALYLGRLCDMRQRPASERVVQVRIEAPEHVDDIVVTYADRHCVWIQAKENLRFTGAIWKKLWVDFESQKWNKKFGFTDRLLLVLGSNIDRFQGLQEICRRAFGSLDYDEWYGRLTVATQSLLSNIRSLLSIAHQNNKAIFALFSHIDIEINTLEQIERDEIPRWIPDSSTQPTTLFRLLRDRCGGQARYRVILYTTSLLEQLKIEHDISIDEPVSSGASAYREVIQRTYEFFEVPGTNLSGKISDLFLWPTLQEIQPDQLRFSTLEEEDSHYRLKEQKGTIDLQYFPISTLKRAVIVAGAGFGKTALLTAIAHRLSYSFWLPILIALPELADSGETVTEFLRNSVNRRFNVSVSWDYYCENGVAVVLFDGLDELAPCDRHRVLELIRVFSNRYYEVVWLLTVRDAKALSAPIDAKILTIDVFDDEQISRFAKAYRIAGSQIDADQLLTQLRTYPDLQLLARIPLFLALILATTESPEMIPHKRSDLIERYLHIVLHPNEYKSASDVDYDPSEMRITAEHLAYIALEQDKIGLSEQDTHTILQSLDIQNTTQHIVALSQCGLLRRITNWVSFTYPIVQEYLAACYLVSHLPNEITQRFELSTKRPWAQTLQFALEKHPEADLIISALLKQNDDAFGSVLRLIGQSIVNGTQVSTTIKAQVGDRLANLWPTLTYGLRINIGKLLADGFISTLPNKVYMRLVEGQKWALQSGGNEIVVASNDPVFTENVLKGFLNRDLEHEYYLRELQSAVDLIAPIAIELYIKRIKTEQTTDNEIEALASLISNLSRDCLPKNKYKILIADHDLTPVVRLAGYILGPYPISNDAAILIDEILRTQENEDSYKITGWRHAVRCLWLSDNSVEKWQEYILDKTLTEKRRDEILFTIMNSSLALNEKKNVLTKLSKQNRIHPNFQHTTLILLSYLGDNVSTQKIIDSLPNLHEENMHLFTSIIGKHNLTDIIKLVEKLNKMPFNSNQRSNIASNLALGLTWDVIIENSRSWYALQARSRHPAILECGRLVERWINEYNYDIEDFLKLLSAGIELESKEAQYLLAQELTRIINEEPNLLQSSDFDHTFSNSLSTLGDYVEIRNILPLNILTRCIEISTSNAAFRAMSMITSYATEEALNRLLKLYRKFPIHRSSLESYIEKLAGKLGIRIVWEGEYLVRE